MAKLSTLAIDLDLANNGTWANFSGVKFLVRRISADEPQALRSKLVMENLDALQADPEGQVAKDLQEQIDVRVLAETVLIGWENLENDDGTPMDFSPEQAAQILSDKRYGDLRTFVQNYSFNRENYQRKAEQAVAEEVKISADS